MMIRWRCSIITTEHNKVFQVAFYTNQSNSNIKYMTVTLMCRTVPLL
jgi:hypothetical protein